MTERNLREVKDGHFFEVPICIGTEIRWVQRPDGTATADGGEAVDVVSKLTMKDTREIYVFSREQMDLMQFDMADFQDAIYTDNVKYLLLLGRERDVAIDGGYYVEVPLRSGMKLNIDGVRYELLGMDEEDRYVLHSDVRGEITTGCVTAMMEDADAYMVPTDAEPIDR